MTVSAPSMGRFRVWETDRVGLDIGHTAIKAVRVRRSLTGQESVTYFHRMLPRTNGEMLDPAQVAGILRRFLRRHQLEGTPITTAFPCQNVFLRTMAFPFQDPKKLSQVVPYEMEALIPVPLDDVTVNSLVLPQAGDREKRMPAQMAQVLVAAAPKARLSDQIQFLSDSGLNPEAIHLDALALFSTVQQLQRDGALVPANLAIIDIGATKTTVCLTHRGRPWVLRTILWGGNVLTEAIARRESCSFQEAERRKRELSAPELGAWLEPLVSDVQRTLHAYEADTKTRIKRAWFCGGGAKLRGLPVYLGREIDAKPLGSRAGFGIEAPRAFSVAYGLAVQPRGVFHRFQAGVSVPTSTINLKRLPVAAVEENKERSRQWWLAVGGAVLLGILAITDLSVRVGLKKAQVENLKAAVQTTFQARFDAGAPEGLELDQAQGLLTAARQRLDLLGRPGPHLLSSLAELVRRIPKEVPLKIAGLTIDRGAIQLDAETNSFESVEKIKGAIGASTRFSEVSVSETRVGTVPNQVLFRVTMEVENR